MDDFEIEYFANLNKLAIKYSSKRYKLAKSRIKMFAASLARQLLENQEKFDAILSSGNSGLFMAEIAKLVYQKLAIDCPKIITLPIFRFEENKDLEIGHQLDNLSTKPNILFIDDEIMSGLTVKKVLELILAKKTKLQTLRCVILAENHFFEWHYNLPKVSVNFFAYSRLIQGLNGNIAHFVPEKLYQKISSTIEGVTSYNHAMAIVLGGALKSKNAEDRPFFNIEVDQICVEKIDGYSKQKKLLIKELEELVAESLKSYSQNKIAFRF